jgi:hypothetical protein
MGTIKKLVLTEVQRVQLDNDLEGITGMQTRSGRGRKPIIDCTRKLSVQPSSRTGRV